MPYASSIQTVNDANGTAYAFLEDNGAIWQCQWNAEAQRWDKGQLVPEAFGGEKLQALVLENLWPTIDSSGNHPGTAPGIVLAYRVGEGSSSQVLASFGRWGSDGQLSWSAPVVLSAPGVEVQDIDLVEGAEEQTFSLVLQAQQPQPPAISTLEQLAQTPQDQLQTALEELATASRPDTDLYRSSYQLALLPGASPSTPPSLQTYGIDSSGQATWNETDTLSPAQQPANPATPSALLGGNTQLSRQQLVAPPPPALPGNLASGGGMMANTDPFRLAAAEPQGSNGGNGFLYSSFVGLNKEKYWFLTNENTRRWSWGGLSRDRLKDARVEIGEQDSLKGDWVFKGGFGKSTFSSSSTFTYSTARLQRSTRNLATKSRFGGADLNPDFLSYARVLLQSEIGVAGFVGTQYLYQDGQKKLTSVQTKEGLSIDYDRRSVYKNVENGTLRFNLYEGFGYAFDQSLSNSAGLPGWLSTVGKVPGWTKPAQGLTSFVYSLVSNWKKLRYIKEAGFLPGYKVPGSSNFDKGLNILSTVVGVSTALLGPVLAIGQGIRSSDEESRESGVSNFTRFTAGGLWHGVIGLQGAVANNLNVNAFGLGNAGSTWEDRFLFNFGIGLPLGIYLPLISYTDVFGSGAGFASGSEREGAAASVDATAAGAPQKSAFISAPDGAAYPFSYAPQSADNSYFAPDASGGPSNPYLLGASTETLQLLTLQPYAGAINSGSEGAAPLTLVNRGRGLLDGSYSDVPILGLALTGGSAVFAKASFTVAGGSIEATSLQITAGGSSIGLPETQPGSGIYVLVLDVFTTGIATPPPPDTSGNPLANLPLLTVDISRADSPLSASPIQRVSSVPVPAGSQASGVVYPEYDPSTDQISAPASNNNGAYTYQAVPVTLLNAGVTLPLLNPGPATATVVLSGGTIQRVDLDQPLLFSSASSGTTATSAFAVQLTLPAAVVASLPAGTKAPSFAVSPRSQAYNNVVAEEEFSAQSGAHNSGVYLAAGASDQLPLLRQMAGWPVQNRVTYSTPSDNGATTTWVLNRLKQTPASPSQPGSTENAAPIAPPSLQEVYQDQESVFTAASHPTAVTIAGPQGAVYSGTTFVAWVEASEPVIPATSADGSNNYQAFLQALYGSQRLNFRILQADGSWATPNLEDLYSPTGAVISQLQGFQVTGLSPSSWFPGGEATLLVWDELSIDAIQDVQPAVGAGASIPSVLKAGWINPAAVSFQWNDLFSFSDTSGQTVSSIQTIPWDASTAVGLTISDISAGSLPVVATDGSASSTAVITFSQTVRTPYRQSVLNDQPSLYLELGALESGLNSINIGTNQDPATTSTFASETGLNFTIAGALPKSQAAAVQNLDGTGVLSTGLGTLNAPNLLIARNIPTQLAVFSGSISGTTLTVSSLSAGQPRVGDGLSGAGVLAGTTITAILNADPLTGLGTYSVNQSQNVAAKTLQALPEAAGLLSFSGAIDGTTLTVTALSEGSLSVGDVVAGQGVLPGTRITAVLSPFDPATGQGSYSVDRSQSLASSALVAAPPVPGDPYTIEFWAQLQPGSNPEGAGLVALGQPSAAAIGPAQLPEGWLLGASFVVDRITFQQAAGQGLITAIPNGQDANATYGWGWAVVATGADTTAMGGNGGNNLYSNALQINNLISGVTLAGVNRFLANYGVSASELIGIDGSTAATMASVPFTELQFNAFLDSSNNNLPTSNLNGIAVDTTTAVLNDGLLLAADVAENSDLSKLFTSLWNYQEQTGEAKVSFDLAPGSSNATTAPSPSSNEQYSGYALEFSLLNGPAVSVNDLGQLVFDVAPGVSLPSSQGVDLRDGLWHYIAASYLPEYASDTVLGPNGTPVQPPTLNGTATLVVDNQVVGSSPVRAAYAAGNLSDQALLLAGNAAGAIDQFALYGKALTTSMPPLGVAGLWPAATANEALALWGAAGVVVPGQTPDQGSIPGALTSHWAARDVNPNGAELATYSSVFDPASHSWSPVGTLNPQLAPQPTTPSASAGSLQNDLVIAVPSSSWTTSTWEESGSSSTDGFFNPAKKQLRGVSVTLTNLTDTTQPPVTIPLTPDQVLVGSESLQMLQPLAQGTSLNYTVLSDAPAFSLLISRDQITPPDAYTATYTFTFADNTSVSNATPVPVNALASSVASSGQSGSTAQTTLENRSKALATAAVLEQAPLQLQYIDSGEVFESRPTAATTSSKALSNTPETFGQSQVFGSFTDSSDNTNGWLAIAQPSSLNAGSDPAGRIWIQYTGQSKGGVPSSDPAQAPTTWLNALANSNFSPDSPNLPLLGDALYPSTSGGLLIQADPTAGWGQQLGQTMLVVDVNNDGTQDLVIAAPAANDGGLVYIVDGSWIQNNLTQNTGSTILNLANPSALGLYVTILRAQSESLDSNGYDTSQAGFGSALAFDASSNTLWIGAPNVLQQLNAGSSDPLSSLVPAGAVYSTNLADAPFNGQAISLAPAFYGSSGTATVPGAAGGTTIEYWGSQLGTAIAVDGSGNLAVSAPGVVASLAYSGTEPVQQQAIDGKTITSPYGDGALVKIQLPGVSGEVTASNGTNAALVDVVSKKTRSAGSQLASEESAYMQTLKGLQSVQIADATLFNNQAYQAAAVGAVYVLPAASLASSPTTAPKLSGGSLPSSGYTLYGPNSWNVLGPSGFGSSLAFADLTNNNGSPMLAIGADQTGGSGAVYLVDTSQSFSDPSGSGWVQDINLGSQQYLAHLASALTLYGAASADNFGNGLVNLGDVNGDSYEDLLIQAFNASGGAGNGYVLFGTDQFSSTSTIEIKSGSLTINNPAAGNVASSTIGQMKRADGSTFNASLLSELGDGPSAFTGLGSFGPGDVNGDGLPDFLLGAGGDASAYLTYGQDYLESITDLQLQKLNSNTGYRLPGLATATQGSLRSIGDFNDDGYGDFISIQPGDLDTTVRLQLGANTQEILADYLYEDYSFTVANGTEVLGAGDINGDGYADIALFQQQNLSSAADGNAGAGSTTGILFGRSSDQLPIGSGFGLQAPVDPSGSTPQAPLLSLPFSSLPLPYGTAAPSLIADGSNLYAVVAGAESFGAATGTLYFAQSSDGGNSWTGWTDISSSWSLQPSMPEAGFAGSSLAFFNGQLYLAFQELTDDGTSSNLALTSWDPSSGSSGPWKSPIKITSSSGGAPFTSKAQPALVNLGTSLGLFWTDEDLDSLSGSSSTNPQQAGSWLSPVAQQQRVRQEDGSVLFEPIYITAAPSVAVFGDQLVMAAIDFYNTDSVVVYALSETGQSWELASSFNAENAYYLDTSPNLTSTDTGLALAYAANRDALYLQRLDLISSAGLLQEGTLSWQQTILPGVSTSLQPTLVNAAGTLLLSTTASTGAQAQLSAVPVLSNPASSTWLNSTVQLPDGSGGWTVQQQSGGNSGLTPAQTGSSLSPVGDLNNDGYADLIVTASNVLLNPGSDPAGATQATGLRVITGAATSAELLSNNNPTANSQTVQVAPGFGGDAGTAVATLSTVSNGAPAIQITSTGLNSGQNATQKSLASKSSQSDLIASAGDLASTQQLFNPATPPTSGPLGLGLGFGNLALNTTGSFGDLNADGYLDALADMPTSVYGANGLGWHVWSIRAAGDVNGNGTDDVLLSLVVPESASIAANSAPQWIQTVLLDGALFNVDTATNSFSFEALRFPLNPDSRLQINDSNPDSGPTWQWEPLLQYWLEPIQTYTPPTGNAFGDTLGDTASITDLDAVASVVPGVANAGSQPSIAVAYYESGTYLVTSTQNASNGAPLVQIGFLNPDSYSPGWTIEVPSDVLSSAYSGTQTLSPSAAAVHDGYLYFVIDQSQDQDESGQGKYSLGDMYLFYAPLSSLEEGNADWRTYQLPATSSLQPALVSEGDRLSLYFASNNDNKRLLSIYSNDPTSSASWEGGSTLAWDSPNGTGDTITINSGSSTPLTANIAAARTLGPNPVTVLAFCMNTAGGAENDQVFVIQQPQPGSSNWSPSQAFNAQPGQIFLTSNSSQLLLATTNLANNPTSYTDYDGSYGVTLYSAVGGIGSTLVGTTVQGESDVIPIGAATVGSRLNVFTQPTDSWGADAGLQPYDSSWAVVDAADQSLAGYSIDASIDSNGDGFMDMLVSDPSNPAAGLANQYVLFGGDYNQLASQVGTPANDELIGTPLADVIYSIQGSDQVISNGGADVIYTGAGDDQVSIVDNGFVRIDAGSGLDALLLEGEANQSYDFRFAVASPQYFAGTKLRSIELISSIDYGANALFFDAAAINAINSDRVLFVTPDVSDSITLSSEFARNTNFDTSYGGTFWNAYAAAPATATPADSNPAVLYVRTPEGQTASWLSTHVLINALGAPIQSAPSATAAPAMASAMPTPSLLSGVSQAFGDGLSLIAFRVNPGEGLARFRITRSDTSRSQLVAYRSSSRNASAELGRDAMAVAGLLRFQPGQASAEITVPADDAALVALRNGSLSLLVEELPDLGQQERHLLFRPAAAPDGAVPVLSGFDFSVDSSFKLAQLSFRADVNNGSGSADALRFQVAQRSSADAAAPPTESLSTLAVLDAVVSDSSVPPAYDSDPAAYALDTDQRHNAQVRSQLTLDLMAKGTDPALFLSGPALSWSSPASSTDGSSLSFDQTVNLSAWRADQGSGVVSFSLVSGDRSISLLQNASGGTAGSITPDSALDPGSSGWRSTEGKAVGSQAALSYLDLANGDWTPTASLNGRSLAYQSLEVDGNRITATFEGGVTLQLLMELITSAPTPTPVRPQVDIQRLAGQDNGLGFYAVDVSTGEVDGLKPGDSGYLQAALLRSEAADLLLEASELPAFAQERTYRELALDPNRQYGVLLLVDGNREQLFSSFAAANPGGAPQMLSLGTDSTGMVLGIEDLAVAGGVSDRDYNDLIVKLGSVNVALF